MFSNGVAPGAESRHKVDSAGTIPFELVVVVMMNPMMDRFRV